MALRPSSEAIRLTGAAFMICDDMDMFETVLLSYRSSFMVGVLAPVRSRRMDTLSE